MRYEYRHGTSNKFWDISLSGKSVKTVFGKIGSKGQTSTKAFTDAASARKEHDKLIAEKLRKGYRLAARKPVPKGTTKDAAATVPTKSRKAAVTKPVAKKTVAKASTAKDDFDLLRERLDPQEPAGLFRTFGTISDLGKDAVELAGSIAPVVKYLLETFWKTKDPKTYWDYSHAFGLSLLVVEQILPEANASFRAEWFESALKRYPQSTFPNERETMRSILKALKLKTPTKVAAKKKAAPRRVFMAERTIEQCVALAASGNAIELKRLLTQECPDEDAILEVSQGVIRRGFTAPYFSPSVFEVLLKFCPGQASTGFWNIYRESVKGGSLAVPQLRALAAAMGKGRHGIDELSFDETLLQSLLCGTFVASDFSGRGGDAWIFPPHALPAVKLLLEAGANPNLAASFDSFDTIKKGEFADLPLVAAVYFRDLPLIQLLLSHGADPTLRWEVEDWNDEKKPRPSALDRAQTPNAKPTFRGKGFFSANPGDPKNIRALLEKFAKANK